MATTTKKSSKSVKTTKRRVLPPAFQTGADLKTALLVVSLIANLFVLCLWIALQVTSRYDQALIDFFISR